MRARTTRASPENGYKLCVCTKDAISRVPYTGGKADIITVLRIKPPATQARHTYTFAYNLLKHLSLSISISMDKN